MVRRLRVKALLLLAIFLSAGTSLPSLDALAHHGYASEEARSQSHIEPAGGCVAHSGHCTLGRAAPGSNAGLCQAREHRIHAPTAASEQPLQSHPRPSNTDVGIPQSRAPPALLA